jgi:succinate dehydrogenase/fumarate reductase cytochrome b subunit
VPTVAYGALIAATIFTVGLGWRDAPKLSTEGKSGLVGTFLSASVYAAITRQQPSGIAWFLAFAQVIAVLVTMGHPKRVLPHEFLDFGEDEPLRNRHVKHEKTYGWVFGLIVVSVVGYVIFTS